MLLHGGFWRDRYDLSLMAPLAADLTRRGWAAWNLEYRRLGSGGGIAEMLDDLAAGIAALPLASLELVAVGHSAGGHLALLAGARGLVHRVAAQAPVSDLEEAARLDLSNDAALELVGGRTELLRPSSPAALLPLGVPQLLVHGEDDDIVPISMSRAYLHAARAAGDDAEIVALPGVGHFEHLEPDSTAWRAVAEWL